MFSLKELKTIAHAQREYERAEILKTYEIYFQWNNLRKFTKKHVIKMLSNVNLLENFLGIPRNVWAQNLVFA